MMNTERQVMSEVTNEKRVLARWMTAAEARGSTIPSDPFDATDWTTGEPQPATSLQFPRQQWATYPARRKVVLALCDRMLDFADRLTDEQWATLSFLVLYGGKTPL